MTKILNLTQHLATDDQRLAGVVDNQRAIDERVYYVDSAAFGGDDGADFLTRHSASVSDMLTFDALPSLADMGDRAAYLRDLTLDLGFDSVMIGGAPFFMPVLDKVLSDAGITVLYAFSQRVSVDTVLADGTVSKTSAFKHIGFVKGGFPTAMAKDAYDDGVRVGYQKGLADGQWG